MKRYKYLFAVAAMFGIIVASCDKNDVLDDNTNPQRQKAGGKIIYVDNVNKEIAGDVATAFITSFKGVSPTTIIASLDSIIDWDGKTAMYIFNFKPAGFVLTSADVANEPIVAYSTQEYFIMPKQDGDIPDALTNMLAETVIVNRWVQEGGKDVPQHIPQNNTNNWLNLHNNYQLVSNFKLNPDILPYIDPCSGTPNIFVSETEDTYGHYCHTTWAQGEPYNYFNQCCPTGCVAVAVAQIMKFHKYPNAFNWSVMPNQCTSSYSNISGGDWEVARLMRDIGVNVNMNYTPNGSGASSSKARKALVNDYKYSSSAKLADYDYNKIVNEIKTEKRPVYADGYGTTWSWRWWLLGWWTVNEYEDGHAYVIDGYQELYKTYYNECRKSYSTTTTKFLHYNYGWNGNYNNWFTTSIRDEIGTFIDVDIITGRYFPNFQYKKQCIYYVKP